MKRAAGQPELNSRRRRHVGTQTDLSKRAFVVASLENPPRPTLSVPGVRTPHPRHVRVLRRRRKGESRSQKDAAGRRDRRMLEQTRGESGS